MNRKVRVHTSVIHKLSDRALTGRRLGLNVHRHSTRVLHLSWNETGEQNVYLNCITRKCSELTLIDEITLPARKRGLMRPCNCVFVLVRDDKRTVGICPHQIWYCHCRVSFVLEVSRRALTI
jgi:hypothetical protein